MKETNTGSQTIETSNVGTTTVTNHDVLKAIFHTLPDNAHIAVCSKAGDPTEGGWSATKFEAKQRFDLNRNQYFNCATFKLNDKGNISAKKEYFAGLHAIVLDDVGSKIPVEKLGELKVSAKIETSPGNYQVILILDQPIVDIAEATAFQKRFIDAGLCDTGASGTCRWARLPQGINGKNKYKVDDKPFQCSLVEWQPKVRHSVATLEDVLAVTELPVQAPSATITTQQQTHQNAIYQPKPKVNPVIAALNAKGLYKKALAKGQHQITCPWVQEHTDSVDNGTVYFEPTTSSPIGGFKCHHSHGERFNVTNLLDYLGVDILSARFQSVIRIESGVLHTIVDAVSQELAEIDNLYQMGNLLVKVSSNTQGQISAHSINQAELTLLLSKYIYWEKFNGNAKKLVPSDPCQKAINTVFESRHLDHVKPLKGLAMQPFYREQQGELVLSAGYDSTSQIFGAFDADNYQLPEPTPENARLALEALEDLLSEFAFSSELDKATALSMLFTAVTRPSLELAPAFHVHASMSGSGKSYLCALAGAMAMPGNRQTVPYPKSADEAKKVLLSLLMESPAVIEFDDLDDDIKPHSIIKQALTSEYITDRILGQSKTATVSTRTLFMFSGNNVGPVRDLLRRIITINLNRQEENPTQVKYQGNPVQAVKQNRALYIGYVLTIIEAWKKAGSPKSSSVNIVTYDGNWSDYCRHPLVWLGLEDPANALIQQVSNDPDAEMFGNLLKEWFAKYKNQVITVRKLMSDLNNIVEIINPLRVALEDCPVSDHKGINPSKFGWYLKKNMNRPVGGLKLVQGSADGRVAWQVIQTQPSKDAVAETPINETAPAEMPAHLAENEEAF